MFIQLNEQKKVQLVLMDSQFIISVSFIYYESRMVTFWMNKFRKSAVERSSLLLEGKLESLKKC